ncbi:cupin domain-containing protein [Kribbella italica]|uniref:Quercetin dioxygenase-like cupin family protein n=1 Tax=Kribbella italica TaxID=1540520 RepID=A0A7W9JEA2_9ACTN|nr:cupin domain-containing protein [Kribbella italica]MBB5840177.1 quercetin dioxygenase-like cupin family protein [Kribbella italica]
MKLYRKGSSTSRPPESTFVGTVGIGGYFRRAAPSRLAGASVTFHPGARTPWKVNPLGQTIVVTDGTGWVQAEGEDIAEVHAGDFIWFAPGQRHWEGATPHEEMTCVAVQEEDGRSVEFWETVSDDEYGRGPA